MLRTRDDGQGRCRIISFRYNHSIWLHIQRTSDDNESDSGAIYGELYADPAGKPGCQRARFPSQWRCRVFCLVVPLTVQPSTASETARSPTAPGQTKCCRCCNPPINQASAGWVCLAHSRDHIAQGVARKNEATLSDVACNELLLLESGAHHLECWEELQDMYKSKTSLKRHSDL